MKKQNLLPLFGLTALLAIGYTVSNKTSLKQVKAIELTTYIPMEASSFTDYTDEKGDFANADATFWDENHHFNALDTFFRGETKEGWTGSLSLKTWIQTTQYVYFTWGGANNGVENKPVLEFHCEDKVYEMENDTFSGNPMLLRYFKIPDSDFEELMTAHPDGFEMYIKLIDQRTENYGFHNFGYLHVNQSEEQVGDAMRYYLNHIQLQEVNDYDPKNIYGHYFANASLKEIFLKTSSNIDEDFESNSNFLNHWYLDVNYDNFEELNRHPDEMLSVADYRSGADYSTMPFNKTGSRFFRGWFENGEGYVASDKPIYRFVSRPFVLGGTGLVSIKMAGRSASLHVIDTETQEDLAWADLRTFNDTGDEKSQYLGFNTVTMVRHYINLSAYLGKTIQLAIADVYDSGWAASYFDELVTKYDTYPSFGIDRTSQQCGEGLQDVAHMYYFDQYISSTHIDNDPDGLKYKLSKEEVTSIDETPINSAYKFLKHYYSALRTPETEFNIEKASDEAKTAIVAEYLSLSEEAQEIVKKSSDLEYNNEFSNEWYRHAVTTSNKISAVIDTLVESYQTYTVSFDSNGGIGTMADVEDVKGEYTLPTCLFTEPENKEFAGWKVNGEGDLLASGSKINVTNNIQLVANWKEKEPVKYTVTFNANEGSGEMEDILVVQGEKLELPENGFTAPEGKEFDCWIVRNELYQPGDKIDIISNTEVFAKWKNSKVVDESYTVSFDSNGGTGTMADVEDVKGEYTLPENGFTAPEGQEFDCWLIGDEKYQPGDKVDINSNTIVVAQWKDKEITPVDPVDPVGPDTPDTPDTPEEPDTPDTPTPVDPDEPSTPDTPSEEPAQKKGCGGSVVASSVLLSTISLNTVLLFAIRKRKDDK